MEILRRKEIVSRAGASAVLGSVPEPIDAAAIAQRLRVREPIPLFSSLPSPDG